MVDTLTVYIPRLFPEGEMDYRDWILWRKVVQMDKDIKTLKKEVK